MRHQLQSEKCRVLQETRTMNPRTASQSSRTGIPREIALNHPHSDETEEHEQASPVVNSPSPSVRTIIADELVPTQRSRYSLRERNSMAANQRSTTSQQQSQQEPSAPNAAAPTGFYRPPEDWPDGISVLHQNPNLNEEHWWEDLNQDLNDSMRNDNEDSYNESNSNSSSSSNSHHGSNADNNSVQDDQAAVVLAPPAAGSSSQQNYPNALVLTQPTAAATTYAGTRNAVDTITVPLTGMSGGLRAQLAKIHGLDESGQPTHRNTEAIIPSSVLPFLELADILDDAGAPHYTFERIINWATTTSVSTNGFHPSRIPSSKKRAGFMKHLRKLLGIPDDERQFNIVYIALETSAHAAYVLPLAARRPGTRPGP